MSQRDSITLLTLIDEMCHYGQKFNNWISEQSNAAIVLYIL